MVRKGAEYIARISYGKDSMKMLEVIHSRGLPLDRITTTDVWATDAISANLSPMEAFKTKMDDWIWTNYRIEVEHLCARNKDGSKRTYEQMFYHVPIRREKRGGAVQARRCPWIPGARNAMVPEAQTRLGAEYRDSQHKSLLGAGNSRSTKSRHLFGRARHDGQGQKYRGIFGNRCGRAQTLRTAE